MITTHVVRLDQDSSQDKTWLILAEGPKVLLAPHTLFYLAKPGVTHLVDSATGAWLGPAKTGTTPSLKGPMPTVDGLSNDRKLLPEKRACSVHDSAARLVAHALFGPDGHWGDIDVNRLWHLVGVTGPLRGALPPSSHSQPQAYPCSSPGSGSSTGHANSPDSSLSGPWWSTVCSPSGLPKSLLLPW